MLRTTRISVGTLSEGQLILAAFQKIGETISKEGSFARQLATSSSKCSRPLKSLPNSSVRAAGGVMEQQ